MIYQVLKSIRLILKEPNYFPNKTILIKEKKGNILAILYKKGYILFYGLTFFKNDSKFKKQNFF